MVSAHQLGLRVAGVEPDRLCADAKRAGFVDVRLHSREHGGLRGKVVGPAITVLARRG